jgi:hypothetical protein
MLYTPPLFSTDFFERREYNLRCTSLHKRVIYIHDHNEMSYAKMETAKEVRLVSVGIKH